MKTVAYLRVSTRSEDLANQKLAILEFSQKRRFPIDQFIESRISSRQSPLERRIDEMLGTLEPGYQGIRQIGAILHAKRSVSDER